MIFSGVFLLSVLLTLGIKRLAITDTPNARSSHVVPVPTGGGMAIVVAFYCGLCILWMQGTLSENIFYALLAGGLLAVVSFIDDMIELSPILRLLTQLSAVMIAFYFLDIFHRFPWYLVSLFLVSALWLINLYNFLDGIDGYAASEGIFVSLGAYFFYHDTLFIIMALAIAGFLLFNWQKASIFMGDVGSTFLGFFFAVMALEHYERVEDIMIWWMLLGVFIFDGSMTLIRRATHGEKLSQAHKKHAFQRLVQSGFSHQKVVLWAMGINVLVFLCLWSLGASFSLLIVYNIILYILLKIVDQKRSFEC